MRDTQPTNAATKPRRIARQVKGWRCWLGFHSWRIRTVCGRDLNFGYHAWEVYEECPRCGDESSYIERNPRVAQAICDRAGLVKP